MSDALSLAPDFTDIPASRGAESPLSQARKGQRGVIVRVGGETGRSESIDPEELERRLLEMGFVEGAAFEVLHEGLFGRDPIAVRIDDMRVALRRREAAAVTVQFEEA
ncbi:MULTISPECIES: FeoA family protein [Caulobacter]|jgi:ferrous iron transport protein A|uniref:Ferrous iron transport protein A n=1 Tax=Caulobacter rhizosphaerae TaxID=2010972 RepID=A0ABU1N1R4_9CAUL|nr:MULTISPECIES: FeoA family protein [Caulobacter]MDR6532061.1 ferrous iron transport protein A [Caulobacter rhizosphaerae]GGL36746.1 iron transporter [Caulobacter rhizosphaerae]